MLKSLRATVLGGEPINASTAVGDEVCAVGGLRTQLLKMQQMLPAVHVGERIIPPADNTVSISAAGYRPTAEEFVKSPPNYSACL